MAVHSYSHRYGTVYESEEAYWADFERMNDIIEEQTGSRTTLFRFPGGSSNTVSSGNPGIMTRLTAAAADKGLTYFDWNVDSDDAGSTKTADGVYDNIIDGILNTHTHLVLCHDVHDYTVEAMDRVLTWCEENGYVVVPLTADSPTMHHRIAN